jgi:hypothetical protein
LEAAMPENHEPIPKPTLTRVLIENPHEVRRWCQRFVCTEQQLRAAVARVGADPQR